MFHGGLTGLFAPVLPCLEGDLGDLWRREEGEQVGEGDRFPWGLLGGRFAAWAS